MKPFEYVYLGLEPLLPPLHQQVRSRLKALARQYPTPPAILDVGGRKSHYSIGVPGRITIIDLPRESEVQHKLHLGVNEQIIGETKRRRSNIAQVILGDMTRSQLPGHAFDCVVAIEVLEHVEEDATFIKEVHRVLKPGGAFLMTTPNGDFVKNTNPDHKRHYRREQLRVLLRETFGEVHVEYSIRGGRWRQLGLKSWSAARPFQTALSMMGNLLNAAQSSGLAIREQSQGTHHLIATARKSNY